MRVQVRVAEALSGSGSGVSRSGQREGAGGTGLEPDVMSEGEGGVSPGPPSDGQ